MSTGFLAVALTALAICSGVSPALAQAKFGSRVPREADHFMLAFTPIGSKTIADLLGGAPADICQLSHL